MNKLKLDELKSVVAVAIETAYKNGWEDREAAFMSALGAKAPASKEPKAPKEEKVKLTHFGKGRAKKTRSTPSNTHNSRSIGRGKATEIAMDTIMTHVQDHGLVNVVTAQAVRWCKAVGVGKPTTWLSLRRLVEGGYLDRVDFGVYKTTEKTWSRETAVDTTVSNSSGIEIFRA